MIVIFWCIRPTDYIRVFFVTLSMNSNILRDKISPRFGALGGGVGGLRSYDQLRCLAHPKLLL